uniref:Uncharacterized protein n=1 Tax=uncultured marine virus TaxID=186617 RepID=A0A0F7L2N5_9VIRU|nr:hypothetical protein [uncultured marine virus]
MGCCRAVPSSDRQVGEGGRKAPRCPRWRSGYDIGPDEPGKRKGHGRILLVRQRLRSPSDGGRYRPGGRDFGCKNPRQTATGIRQGNRSSSNGPADSLAVL